MPRRTLNGPEWAELFTGFTRSAFRLEGMQTYNEPAEQEGFVRFLAGKDPEVDLTWWTRLTQQHVGAGRTMRRVRIVQEPPSDYTLYELAHYPLMAAAGEDIRIISIEGGAWPAGVPRYDYWMFDQREVWIMNYDSAGTFRCAELHDDPASVADHIMGQGRALGQATPVSDYLAARPHLAEAMLLVSGPDQRDSLWQAGDRRIPGLASYP